MFWLPFVPAAAISKDRPDLTPTRRGAALQACRRLLRGFAGAPDPRRHAQTLYAELTHAEGWSAKEEQLILALGAWLQDRPELAELRAGCETCLARLNPGGSAYPAFTPFAGAGRRGGA